MKRAQIRLPTNPCLAAAALLACATLLSACSSAMVEDHMPTAVGGLPDSAPPRPIAEVAYPAVHNMPPARATTPLSYDQQKRLEDDLVATRNKYGKDEGPAATGSTPKDSKGSSGNGTAGSAQNP
jgi:hypothetical protein